MTQEEWNNAVRNSIFARMQAGAYPRRAINNGYSTAPPTYNPYATQFNRNTPPINQALTLTPRHMPQSQAEYQPQYVQTTNAYGQPVRVSTATAIPARETLNEYIIDPAINWIKDKGAELATLGTITSGGLAGVSAYGGSPIGAARLAINSNSYLPSAIATFAATQYGRPIVSGINNFVNNPYVQKADQVIGRYGDWVKNLFS